MMCASAFTNNASFTEKLKNNSVPTLLDITFEGYSTNYFFDTGVSETKEFMDVTFSYGVTTAAASKCAQERDYFLAIGLNSKYDNNPPRQNMKLVFLLDISGSMSSSFSNNSSEGAQGKQSKLDVAKTSLTSLFTNQLRKEDHVCIIAFDDKQEVVLPMTRVGELSKESIIKVLAPLQPRGGTTMGAGMDAGFQALLAEQKNSKEKYEYRMMVLTDMNTSLGRQNTPNGLHTRIQKFAEKHNIYVTYLGIGLDFNTELATSLSGIKGGNYFTVESEKEFREQMEKNFDYMVSPIGFDVVVNMDSQDFEIVEVLGVPGSANKNAKEMIFMKNIFPSAIDDNGLVQGGIILAKLKKISNVATNYKLGFTVSCVDFIGEKHHLKSELILGEKEAPFFESNGVQKAILLYQHMQLCIDVIKAIGNNKYTLFTSKETKAKVKEFHDYFVKQMEELADPSLSKEVDTLVAFLNAPDSL